MNERKGIITMQGNPLTLLGPALKVGDKAPDFSVIAGDLSPVTLANSKGNVRLLNVVPSLDTPVCDAQTRRFDQEAEKFPSNIEVLTISMDLPFAQKRFCNANSIKSKTLSDFNTASFGTNYGVLVKELRLLTRAIFVVGADDKIKYLEIVPEITTHPNYDKALAAVKA
ncbi:MAG: thiol peroxidase [Nitrospirae bacterium]|nr:thiol peroxidase [Nitrospirota bacterium]MBI3594779.1 thiol peroxidase [Nitrospirota bacterium]